MDENINFCVENVSFFIYLYNSQWMNKTYNQLKVKRSLIVDRHTVLGNYPVISQELVFKRWYIIVDKYTVYIVELVTDTEINFSRAVNVS